jgi:uncharacterized phage protein gp47/JayE
MTVPSFDDLGGAFERAVLLLDTPITLDAVRAEGSNVNLCKVGAQLMGQEIASFAETEFAAMFLSTAARRGGEPLDRYVYDRYQLRRLRASAAVVPLSFARTDPTLGFTIAAGSVVGTAGGVLFETLNDLPFPAGLVGPLSVNGVAQEVGTAGNVAVNTITQLITKQPDTTLVVRNLEKAAGGTADQTELEYAAAAQNFFVAAQCGTQTAVLAAVLRVPGVAQAFVDEMLDGNGDPAGIGQIVIADGSGGGNSVLAARVLAALPRVRGLGVPCLVTAGAPVFVDIESTGLLFRAGFDSTSVLADARTRVLAVVNVTSPNETLESAAITAALKSTPGLLVPDGSLLEPAGDYVPAAGEVIRTTADRIRLNDTVGAA